MEALNFGTANNSHWCMGAGAGPHVMVDLENGLWAGNCVGVNPQNTPLPYPFVTAMAKGGRPGGGFALKGGDATVAAGLKTMYEGFYPPRYSMKKQGASARSRGPIRRRPPCRFSLPPPLTATLSPPFPPRFLAGSIILGIGLVLARAAAKKKHSARPTAPTNTHPYSQPSTPHKP